MLCSHIDVSLCENQFCIFTGSQLLPVCEPHFEWQGLREHTPCPLTCQPPQTSPNASRLGPHLVQVAVQAIVDDGMEVF